MMRRAGLVVVVIAAAAVAKEDAETKAKSKIAKVWLDYARWLEAQRLKTEASEVVARARELDPQLKDLDRVAAAVEALDDGATDAAGLAKRREKAYGDAAKLYDKLFKLKHDPRDDARFEEYLFRAVELDPSTARVGRLAALVRQAAGNKSNVQSAGRMLVRLREKDEKDRYLGLEIELASNDVALIKGEHAMVGWVSLPKGWKAGKEWPVLVAVDGAGSNFLGAARGFAKARGSRDFIVLAPCGFANTNPQTRTKEKYPYYGQDVIDEGNRDPFGFDVNGLEALLAAVRARYGGTEKIGITGFSGGGNLCYGFTLLHPERILFAAPACPNFTGMGARDAKRPEDGGPPIHIFTGAEDPHRDFTFGDKNQPGIEPQTDRAVAVLAELGFTRVERTMLPGVKHSSCAGEVWKFADEIVK